MGGMKNDFVRCKFPYTPPAAEPGTRGIQLSMKEGDVLLVFETTGGWSAGNKANVDFNTATMDLVGQTAWFPTEYTEPIDWKTGKTQSEKKKAGLLENIMQT